MAKKDKDEMAAQGMPQTMEDYLLSQLEEQVVLKDGSTLKGQDGHVMTKQEAIAVNLINNAMKGDTKASSHSDLSYPDKRDCAVRQRAKKTTNFTNFTN